MELPTLRARHVTALVVERVCCCRCGPRLSYVPKGPEALVVFEGEVIDRCRVVLEQVPVRDGKMAGSDDKRLASAVVVWRSRGMALVDTRERQVRGVRASELSLWVFIQWKVG